MKVKMFISLFGIILVASTKNFAHPAFHPDRSSAACKAINCSYQATPGKVLALKMEVV
jgi:hypothetical protein